MTTRKATPRLPAGLAKPGAALWRRMHRAYDFSSRCEVDLLEVACRQADDIAQLEAAIEEHGVMVTGSQGQPRLNPAVAEVRLSRAALARIMGQLELPGDASPQAAPASANAAATPAEAAETAASRRGRKAAEARWAKVTHLAPGKGA